MRQFVKEKLLTRTCPATPLLEVTVSDTGEGSLGDALRSRGVPFSPPLTPKLSTPGTQWPCLAEPSRQRDVLKALGALVRDFYAKYWICVCAGMFIVVSFAGRLVVYKIVYMFLFLLCLTLFQVREGGHGDAVPNPGGAVLTSLVPQVYYSLWRKVLKGFWWLVVAYTMLVLIAVYTFQFEDFPMYWRNLTGLTNQQ